MDWALALALPSAGNSRLARMAMMATTTRSSMSVNARSGTSRRVAVEEPGRVRFIGLVFWRGTKDYQYGDISRTRLSLPFTMAFPRWYLLSVGGGWPSQSARGLAQSKALRDFMAGSSGRQLLECASPLALSHEVRITLIISRYGSGPELSL